MPDLQDLNDLAYFAHVVEHGGFAAAGRALGVPKSKLSRRIAVLEVRLGVQLLQRSTRRLSVTVLGQAYYAHCKAVLVEAQSAQEVIDLSRSGPCGTVRVSCPTALLHTQVAGMLADFMATYPRVQMELEATNRRVDVVGEGIDLALRVRPGPLADSELVLRVLSKRSQCLVASPALAARHRAVAPQDLAAWPSLALGQPMEEFAWVLHHGSGAEDDVDDGAGEVRVRHTPRLVTTDMHTLRRAALAGVGVVQMPTREVADALADGRLVPALAGWSPRSDIIHAVFSSRRGMLPTVRALLDELVRRFAEADTHPVPAGTAPGGG